MWCWWQLCWQLRKKIVDVGDQNDQNRHQHFKFVTNTPPTSVTNINVTPIFYPLHFSYVNFQISASVSRTEQYSHVKSPMLLLLAYGSETIRKSMNPTISNLFLKEINVNWSLKVFLIKISENMNSGIKSKYKKYLIEMDFGIINHS